MIILDKNRKYFVYKNPGHSPDLSFLWDSRPTSARENFQNFQQSNIKSTPEDLSRPMGHKEREDVEERDICIISVLIYI